MGTDRTTITSLPTLPLWQYWRAHAPARIAVYADGTHYTWQQVCEAVDNTSYQLHQQGVSAGDVVTVVGKNHVHMLWILLAAHQLGASCAFTMPQPMTLLARKLSVLYAREQRALIWLAPDITSAYDPDFFHEQRQRLHIVSPHEVTPKYIPPIGYSPDHLASLIFTSGSTGDPKAVAHSHRQHCASAIGLLQSLHFVPGDSWLLSLPLYHVSGLSIIYRWLVAGASVRIGCQSWLDEIAHVTHASLVPLQLQRLLDHERADEYTARLSHVLLGGSHIPQELGLRAAALGIETWLGYGMTEAASTVTARRVQDGCGVGGLLAHRELQIQDQRIWLRGATLASGYYHQGTLTSLFDANGWFDTQDLGYWHKADDLVILGRADNQFISGGENIHCEEIEAVLNQHQAVQSAIVVPIADARYGARPVAIVRTTVELTTIDWPAWLQDKLEKFKWPTAYYVMPTHLDTGAIKLPRRALQEWLLQCHVLSAPPAVNSTRA